MSILSNYTASPTRVLGLYRHLLHLPQHRQEEEELRRSFMPPATTDESAGAPRKILTETISAGKSLGLWSKESNELQLQAETADVRSDDSSELDTSEEEATSLRLWKTVVEALWTESDNDDLGYAAAWFLAQDPAKGGWTQNRVSEHIKDTEWSNRTGISESGKYTCFRDWMTYLGFGWHVPGTSRRELLPDPTAHIRRRLADVFDDPGKKMTFPAFSEHLADLSPVLDGGRFRQAVEADQPSRPENHVSASTALALQRLEDEHIIELVSKADAPSHLVLEVDGARRQITHVVWLPEEQ